MPRKRDEIADAIAARIASGDYAAGEKLPNRHDLAREYGTSVETLGEAMEVLAERGVVVVKGPPGTFVAVEGSERRPSLAERVTALEEWRAEMERRQSPPAG